MNELTVIIVFLNEGIEIERTVKTIRGTAGDAVDLMLINDASTDGYDYESVATQYNARYYVNQEKQGPARSRDIGISMIDTPYFLLLDGHMRLYDNNWWNVIPEQLHKNERAIYCCQCKVLDENFEVMRDRDVFGAYIQFVGKGFFDTLEAFWLIVNNDDPVSIDIPCILGACYAASKKYWTYLNGYKGLYQYGSEEPYISIKAWLEGGRCILLKQLEMGHIFRNKFPYTVYLKNNIYNKLVIAETLLSPVLKAQIFSVLQDSNRDMFYEAFEMLIRNKVEIMELKTYNRQIFTVNLDSFLAYNQSVILNHEKGCIQI